MLGAFRQLPLQKAAYAGGAVAAAAGIYVGVALAPYPVPAPGADVSLGHQVADLGRSLTPDAEAAAPTPAAAPAAAAPSAPAPSAPAPVRPSAAAPPPPAAPAAAPASRPSPVAPARSTAPVPRPSPSGPTPTPPLSPSPRPPAPAPSTTPPAPSTPRWFLTGSGSLSTATPPAGPVPDYDGDKREGWTLERTKDGLAETKDDKRLDWTMTAGSRLRLKGTAVLDLLAVNKDDATHEAAMTAYLQACGSSGCRVLAQGTRSETDWEGTDGSGVVHPIRLGAVDTTLARVSNCASPSSPSTTPPTRTCWSGTAPAARRPRWSSAEPAVREGSQSSRSSWSWARPGPRSPLTQCRRHSTW